MVKGHIYAVARLPHGASASAFDPNGNVVLVDPSANKILVLALRSGKFYGRSMIKGQSYPVAGSGAHGRTGDGGPALRAQLYGPEDLAVDHHGNLVIADTVNSRIRVVAVKTGRFYGQRMREGDIYTVVNQNGAWFTGGFHGDGGLALRASIRRPGAVAVDRFGNLLISDVGNERVRMVAARSGTFFGKPMKAWHIYTLAGDHGEGLTGNGGLAEHASILPGPLAFDGSGNLLISDIDQVQVVAASAGTFYGQHMKLRHIYDIAGATVSGSRLDQDGWLAPRVQLGEQSGMTIDSFGNLIMTDWNGSELAAIAGQTGTFYGRSMVKGHYYLIAGASDPGLPANGGPALTAGIESFGAAVDQAGNLIVTDVFNDQIRVIANSSGTFYGQQMTAGDIYAIAGGGSGAPGSGDGGPALQAVFRVPEQIALDSAGNIVFADAGDDRIRVVATSTGLFYGQQMTAGDIYTIAGTGDFGNPPNGAMATAAHLGGVQGLALDSAGNVVFGTGDERTTGAGRIRVVATASGSYYGQAMLAGRIYTIAGGGTDESGSGVPALQASLVPGLSILIDPNGNIVIPGGQRVRVVAAGNGTFYGVPMTSGEIYTVAGTGVRGFSGDTGPALQANLEDPESAAVDAAGDLVIGDGARIRMLRAG